MTSSDLHITRPSTLPVDELSQRIQEIALAHGFRTLHVHDVQATLAEKGFTLPAYRIIEVCNARFAHDILTRHPVVGMMLPCRIAVYEQDHQTIMTLMKPELISLMMPDFDLGDIPAQVEATLIRVMDEAAA